MAVLPPRLEVGCSRRTIRPTVETRSDEPGPCGYFRDPENLAAPAPVSQGNRPVRALVAPMRTSSYSRHGCGAATPIGVPLQHRLRLGQRLLHGEFLTSARGLPPCSMTQRLPRTIMRPLVMITSRQRAGCGLGLEQGLGLGEEPRCWLPRLARRGQVRHVGQADRDGGEVPFLPQPGQLLAKPARRLVELAGDAGECPR